MFIAIGRALIESLQISDPITMFFTLKKAMATKKTAAAKKPAASAKKAPAKKATAKKKK